MRSRAQRLSTVLGVAAGLTAPAAALAISCIPDLPAHGTGAEDSPSDDGPSTDDQEPGDGGPQPRCGDGIVQLGPPDNEQCDPGSTPLPAQCRACKVVCNGGVVWAANNHCYVDLPDGAVVDNNVAQSRCGVPSHDVTFASEQEIEAVIGPLEAGPYWVGFAAKQQPNQYLSLAVSPEPGWTPQCSGCFMHTSDPTVLPGQPSDNCVQGFPQIDASWQATPCQDNPTPLDVVCEREPLGHAWTPCDAGYCFQVPFTLGYKSYVFSPVPTTVTQAGQACAGLGGLLVVFQSRDEREQIWRELESLPPGIVPVAIWIGLTLPDGGAPSDPTAWVWADDASADAYPPEWGLTANLSSQPANAQSNAVAYGPQAATDLVDDTLAENTGLMMNPFVCQLPTPVP